MDAVHGFPTDGYRYTSFDAPGTGTVNQVFDVTDGGTIVGYSGRYVSGSTPDPDRAANDILDLWLARAWQPTVEDDGYHVAAAGVG